MCIKVVTNLAEAKLLFKEEKERVNVKGYLIDFCKKFISTLNITSTLNGSFLKEKTNIFDISTD